MKSTTAWKPKERNKEKEKEFLEGDDISVCPCCGNIKMWITWGREERAGTVVGLICTECGWLCGEVDEKDLHELKRHERTEKKIRRAERAARRRREKKEAKKK